MTLNLQQWHARFTQQVRWTRSLRQYIFQRLQLTSGQSVLEVGCGTGAVLAELPFRNVIGLDIEPAYLATAAASAPAASLVCADGYRLPFQSSHFDACLCHYLLLWTANPLVILREMKRVTQPGGYVLALAEPDYGGRIDYPDELALLGEWQTQSLAGQGANTRIGRQLPDLFNQAGLKDVEAGILGGQWHQPPSEADWEMEWTVLESDLSTHPEFQQLAQDYQLKDKAAWAGSRRILFIPTFYAWGRVP